MSKILQVKNLTIDLKKKKERISAVDHLSLSLERGKTLGIIGESGSGKSLTCNSILGLLNKATWDVKGEMLLEEKAYHPENRKVMQKICGNRIALIMQNPMSAFNPVITIRAHFEETLNKPGVKKKTRAEVAKIAEQLLERMYIRDPKSVLDSYAFQLSGGMLQRIMIALALAVQPEILVADEPTTALDLSVQYEILKILKELQAEYNMSVLIVSHDLSVIRSLSDEIAVMYAGNFVEKGPAEEVLENPMHPYTRLLFAAKPDFTKNRLPVMQGQPPTLGNRAEGCRFRTRCPYEEESCAGYCEPVTFEREGHYCSCRKWESINGGAADGNSNS